MEKKLTYSEKLKSPKWQKLRLAVLNRDEFTCRLCKDTETTLNVHHTKYTTNKPWNEPIEHLVTLCEHCHFEVEDNKKTISNFNSLMIIKKVNNKTKERMMILAIPRRMLSISIYSADGKQQETTTFGTQICAGINALTHHVING